MKKLMCLIAIFCGISLVAASSDDFIIKVNTAITDSNSTDSKSILIPLQNGPYDIDWDNDGVYDETTGSPITSVSHAYSTEGIYTIRIHSNNAQRISYISEDKDRNKLLEVKQWGTKSWSSMSNAFNGCKNLNVTATDAPILTNCNDFSYMFCNCSKVNFSMNNWDMSKATNLEYMFYNATSFNGDISGWNVANVTNMKNLFQNATSFTGDISNWNVSKVTNMSFMFYNTNSFNGDISNWDVSSVNDMGYMFYDMTLFNGDLSNWDVSNVNAMDGMFYNASSFNSDISNWNVLNVTDMGYMFYNASSFNGDLSKWNVSNVVYMDGMLYNATSFNGDISNWNVINVTDMTNILNGVQLTTEIYDSILKNWSTLTLQSNVLLDAPLGYYSPTYEVIMARDKLIKTFSWTILDAGEAKKLTIENGSAAGSGYYAINETVNIIATPAQTGYHFTTWTSDNNGTFENPARAVTLFQMPSNDVTITANYEINSYTVTTTSSGNGTVIPESQTVEHGSSSTEILANANTGYHFEQWNDGNTDNPRVITNVTGDINIEAKFAIDQFLVTATSDENGTVAPKIQTVEYDNNSEEIYAIPSNGYHFVQWSDGNTDNPRVISNVTASTNITANFEINQFTVNASSAGNGTVEPETQEVNYNSNSTEITATPAEGYHFKAWSGGNTDNPRIISNVTENIDIIANFEINQFTVNASSAGNGTVTPDTQTVDYNTSSISITALPATGYHFDKWSDGNTDNPRVIPNVTKDIDITANFEINQLTVTANSTDNGTVEPATQTVDYNDDSEAITASPAEGYHFKQWADGNTDNPRIIQNVTETTNITAIFEINQLQVTADSDGNGTVTPESQVVNYNDDSTLITATPSAGYHFVQWDDDNTDNPRIISDITESKHITANFEINQYTVTAQASENGTVSPETQSINYGNNSVKITATPSEGYHFVKWSDGNTDNPRIISNVTDNININAEFAINTYTVTFTTDNEKATLVGELSQVVEYGGTCSPVTVEDNGKCTFKMWTGTNGFETTDANPLIVTNVTSDMVITANFSLQCVSTGNIIVAHAEDIPGLQDGFVKTPKLYAELTQAGSDSTLLISLGKISKINSETPVDEFLAYWKKAICLFNQKDLKAANKEGTSTSLWLQNNPIQNLPFTLKIKTQDQNGEKIETDLGIKQLIPPAVTGIYNEQSTKINSVNKGDVIIIRGLYFGQKAPKVSLEYLDASGKIKHLKLKVLKPLEYADAKGKPHKSCMNPQTGESQIRVQVLKSSKALPEDANGVFDLIIDNKFGIATDKETGKVPSIKVLEEVEEE